MQKKTHRDATGTILPLSARVRRSHAKRLVSAATRRPFRGGLSACRPRSAARQAAQGELVPPRRSAAHTGPAAAVGGGRTAARGGRGGGGRSAGAAGTRRCGACPPPAAACHLPAQSGQAGRWVGRSAGEYTVAQRRAARDAGSRGRREGGARAARGRREGGARAARGRCTSFATRSRSTRSAFARRCSASRARCGPRASSRAAISRCQRAASPTACSSLSAAANRASRRSADVACCCWRSRRDVLSARWRQCVASDRGAGALLEVLRPEVLRPEVLREEVLRPEVLPGTVLTVWAVPHPFIAPRVPALCAERVGQLGTPGTPGTPSRRGGGHAAPGGPANLLHSFRRMSP